MKMTDSGAGRREGKKPCVKSLFSPTVCILLSLLSQPCFLKLSQLVTPFSNMVSLWCHMLSSRRKCCHYAVTDYVNS